MPGYKVADAPKVGLGVIIVDGKGRVLVMKRNVAHTLLYAIPGGHLELGETFEAGAAREIKEEVNLDIKEPVVIGVTNNLDTYRRDGMHYISIILLAKNYSGNLKNLEPEKCEELLWTDPRKLPEPHFDASRLGIDCYLKGSFYEGIR